MRTADSSADGRRSSAIFATVELTSAGAYRIAAAVGDTLFTYLLLFAGMPQANRGRVSQADAGPAAHARSVRRTT